MKTGTRSFVWGGALAFCGTGCGGESSEKDTDLDTARDGDLVDDAVTDSDEEIDAGDETDTSDNCWEGNYSVTTSDEAEALKPYACVTGNLQITAPALADFDLTNLAWVAGSVVITNNPMLANLNGLSSLVSIGGQLGIYGNDMLGNVSGLASLSSIGSGLVIQHNVSLASLAGLDSVSVVAGNLWIEDNASLSCP